MTAQFGFAPGGDGRLSSLSHAAGGAETSGGSSGEALAQGVPVPTRRPGAEETAPSAETAEAATQEDTAEDGDYQLASAPADQAGAKESPEEAADAGNQAATAAASSEPDGDEATADGVAEPDAQAADAQDAKPKKRGFLSAFFSPAKAQAAPAERAIASKQPAVETEEKSEPVAAAAPREEEKPVITLASADPTPARAAITGSDALPGVRDSEALYEISRKSGSADDGDVDIYEGESFQVASAAGLARLAPNGLLKQRDSVDVACLKPALVRVLKTVERKFGKHVVVTSGYRSPSHNRRVRGARNSLHMYCAAADIQVEGVSKWQLASYVRSMPGRGGVGTYCHTNSVHVDVGPERDWNWRCRRRK